VRPTNGDETTVAGVARTVSLIVVPLTLDASFGNRPPN